MSPNDLISGNDLAKHIRVSQRTARRMIFRAGAEIFMSRKIFFARRDLPHVLAGYDCDEASLPATIPDKADLAIEEGFVTSHAAACETGIGVATFMRTMRRLGVGFRSGRFWVLTRKEMEIVATGVFGTGYSRRSQRCADAALKAKEALDQLRENRAASSLSGTPCTEAEGRTGA